MYECVECAAQRMTFHMQMCINIRGSPFCGSIFEMYFFLDKPTELDFRRRKGRVHLGVCRVFHETHLSFQWHSKGGVTEGRSPLLASPKRTLESLLLGLLGVEA